MTEKPILFSGEMVKAILAGNKTQTRRMTGLEIVNEAPDDWTITWQGLASDGNIGAQFDRKRESEFLTCKYGGPGDRLWVRETFMPDPYVSPLYVYRATEKDPDRYVGHKWKPSIFMPRDASRLTLQITAVRCERLQDISDADCLAEGILTSKDRGLGAGGFRNYARPDDYFAAYAFCEPGNSYRSLWEKINGKPSWKRNPWVWVVAFKKVFNVEASEPPTRGVASTECANGGSLR